MSRFQGVYTIMPTPFMDDGKLDLVSLETLTKFLVKLGVDGVVVLGVMGEAPKLSQAEQDDVIRTTVAAAEKVPVFAGSGAEGTDLAVEKSLNALSLGAAGLLVAPPPVQNDAVIFEYYKRINDAITSPIILHDYPVATGIKMSPQLVVKLYELSNVKVIKLEETPSIPKITAIRNLGCDISIVGGLGGMFFLEELGRGADGMMTGFSYPEILQAIYKAYTSGNKREAARIFYEACPLLRYEFQPGIGLALRKEVYRQRGAIASAFVRHPGTQIDEHLRQELADVLAFSKLDKMSVHEVQA
jgi:4-hydroxy-tetrahydrodipicolinate synthase